LNLIFILNQYNYAVRLYTYKTGLWYNFTASLVNSTLNFLIVLLFVMFFYKIFTRLLLFTLFIKSFPFIHKYSILVIPQQLLIGYNVIHPPLFYVSFLVIIFSIVESQVFFRVIYIMLCGFLALLLGGVWGLGNTVWGFFWVNDFIELILLSCLILLILLQHTNWNKSFPQFIFYFLFLLIVALLSARWGVLFTRHNFFNFNNIKNLVFSYCYWSSLAIPKYPYYCTFLFITVFYINMVVLILIYKFVQNIVLYNKFWSVFHLFLFGLTLSWLKTREHNLVYFLNLICFRALNYIYFTDQWVYFLNYFFSLKSSLNIILSCTIMLIYGLKVSNSIFKIIFSYFFFLFIIVFLTLSIRKVYVSYVQS